jgi:DNA polymerase-1
VSGRFSSSNPNFQNITRTGGNGEGGFEIKGALVPRDGFTFYNFDFAAQELRLMLDLAGAAELCEKIKAGQDPHQATADMVGISRQSAKTLNFALIYSAGPARIAEMLGIGVDAAKKLRAEYFHALPEVQKFIRSTIHEAEDYKCVRTWFGRVLRFPSRDECYRAPNHRIQGGSSDIVKLAIVACYAFLVGKKSRMILTVHDSIIFEIAHGEEWILLRLKELMIAAYPHRILPMDVSIERAASNMAETEGVTNEELQGWFRQHNEAERTARDPGAHGAF